MFDFDLDGDFDAMDIALIDEFEKGIAKKQSEDELALAGLDIDELELMDDFEREELLYENGFDPDEFDF